MPSMRAVAALALGLGLTFSACSDSDDMGGMDHGGGASDLHTAGNGDTYNDADVDFATHMIPHHAQAIQMVVMAEGRPLEPEVAELANAIRDAQAPEVEQMVDWLTAWGEEVPETSMDHANAGHDMSEMTPMDGMDDVPGMMTAEEMQALMDAPDAEFQDLWLEMMVEHHRGAIEMALTEQGEGLFEPAVQLAEDIEAAQESEIDVMEGWLS